MKQSRQNTLTFFASALLISISLVGILPLPAAAETIAERLSGRIVLQVEANGEAWYIDTNSNERYYLSRPSDAFNIMRELGLGITNADLARIPANGTSWDAPADVMRRVQGKILLQVERNGEAWYVYPVDKRRYYLGRPDDAFSIMRNLGLGITNADLYTIPIADDSYTPPTNTVDALRVMEQDTFNRVNAYRETQNLEPLVWNEAMAEIARGHSTDMATGAVPFSHDGFNDRASQIFSTITNTYSAAENIAYNNYSNPAATAVTGWIESTSHRETMENANYTISGMGVAKSGDRYYFTQLFAEQR